MWCGVWFVRTTCHHSTLASPPPDTEQIFEGFLDAVSVNTDVTELPPAVLRELKRLLVEPLSENDVNVSFWDFGGQVRLRSSLSRSNIRVAVQQFNDACGGPSLVGTFSTDFMIVCLF